MTSGKQISIIEIMRHIQAVKHWELITVSGEDVLKYTEFQTMLVFELGLTSNRRKIRELWGFLATSPVVRIHNKKDDLLIIEVAKFNAFLSGAEAGASFRGPSRTGARA